MTRKTPVRKYVGLDETLTPEELKIRQQWRDNCEDEQMRNLRESVAVAQGRGSQIGQGQIWLGGEGNT